VSAFSPSPVDNSHESVLFLLRVTFSNDAQEAATLSSDNRSEFEFCGSREEIDGIGVPGRTL
jgi:hypothetical protein